MQFYPPLGGRFMHDRNLQNAIAVDSTLFISAKGLKGKQSVRATFRLPDDVIKLLGIVASQLGLKQKSLFDQLIEDKSVLDIVAENAPETESSDESRRQKTFVLSRRSLEVLDTVAKQKDIPRDLLVEVSIQRLLPVMIAEQEKHRKRTIIYKEMENYLRQGRKLLEKTGKILNKEDLAYSLLEDVVGVCEEKVSKLGEIVEKGQSMEDYKAG
jgi:hypothetical protein